MKFLKKTKKAKLGLKANDIRTSFLLGLNPIFTILYIWSLLTTDQKKDC